MRIQLGNTVVEIREVSRQQANNRKHVKGCAGYEDCVCFNAIWRHADIYTMQQEIRRLRKLAREYARKANHDEDNWGLESVY